MTQADSYKASLVIKGVGIEQSQALVAAETVVDVNVPLGVFVSHRHTVVLCCVWEE